MDDAQLIAFHRTSLFLLGLCVVLVILMTFIGIRIGQAYGSPCAPNATEVFKARTAVGNPQ